MEFGDNIVKDNNSDGTDNRLSYRVSYEEINSHAHKH